MKLQRKFYTRALAIFILTALGIVSFFILKSIGSPAPPRTKVDTQTETP